MLISFLIIYAIVSTILYIIGYRLFCKSYTKYRHKDCVSFEEYYDDRWGLFIVPAFGWPVIIAFFLLILLIGICYLATRKIKKYYNIKN